MVDKSRNTNYFLLTAGYPGGEKQVRFRLLALLKFKQSWSHINLFCIFVLHLEACFQNV